MHTAPLIPVVRPGERIIRLVWIMALVSAGRLASPTVERVNQIKALAAAWQTEDDTGENVGE